MYHRSSSVRGLRQDPQTTTIMTDEQEGIDLITKTNQKWAEEFQLLLKEYQSLKENYEGEESKYRETQKENMKLKTNLELSKEKFNREKLYLVEEKDDLNKQCEKLRVELREKSNKVWYKNEKKLFVSVYRASLKTIFTSLQISFSKRT